MILSLHDLCLFGKKKNRDLMDLDNAGVFVPLQKLPVLLFKRLISAVVKVLSWAMPKVQSVATFVSVRIFFWLAKDVGLSSD